MKINWLVKTLRNILILYQFTNIIIQQMLSISHPSDFALSQSLSLSLSLSFERSSLISSSSSSVPKTSSLNFSLMVVVVFNLSPLCIEKYFLSWHLLSWCLQNLNPFCSFIFLVMFLNRILYSGCVVWSMRSQKFSREKAFSFHSQSSCVNVVVVKITVV